MTPDRGGRGGGGSRRTADRPSRVGLNNRRGGRRSILRATNRIRNVERGRSIPLRERNVPERMDREGGEQSLSKQNTYIYKTRDICYPLLLDG